MTILALDLGLKTGVFAGQADRGDSCSFCFDIRKFRKNNEGYSNDFFAFLALLHTIIRETAPNELGGPITEIAVEDAAFQPGNAAPIFHGLKAITLVVASLHNIPVFFYPVGTIKKHFTGSGSAKKDKIIAACALRGTTFTAKQHNEADAMALFCTHVEKGGGTCVI